MSEVTYSKSGIQEDKVRERTTLLELFSHLWPYFMRHKPLFFTTLAAVLGLAIAGRLSVSLFGFAIDYGILKKDPNFIVIIASAYFLLELSRAGMMFLQEYLFARVGNRILFEIRHRLVAHVQSLPISYFEKNPTGRIVTRITSDVVSLGEVFTQGIINVFSSVISMIAIIVAMSVISIKMTLIVLLITPPLLWIVTKLSQRILAVLRESKAKLAAINAYVAENVGGMKLLQLYGRIDRNSRRFNELSGQYRSQQMKSVNLYALLWPTMGFFNALSVAAALYFGGILTMEGAISTGAMVAFILHVRSFIEPLHVILEKYQILQNSLSGAERIFTLLEEKPEEAPSSLSSPKITKVKGQVEFQGLSFKYQDHLPYALEKVSFSVQPGQSVALVGRTGSGKSTLITLLQRFYDPTEGKLLIDGIASTEIPRREIRSRIGVVQQDTFMFRGTIAENISLAAPDLPEEQIMQAAEAAYLTDILKRHRGGINAKVEERGANLSQGERQLIAFARILAFDPDILILDEATANIDSKTESLIQEATKRVRKGRTSFIIAHRISTILDCDLIVVLDHGRLIEMGTHQELFAKRGHYWQLCQSQFGSSFGLGNSSDDRLV